MKPSRLSVRARCLSHTANHLIFPSCRNCCQILLSSCRARSKKETGTIAAASTAAAAAAAAPASPSGPMASQSRCPGLFSLPSRTVGPCFTASWARRTDRRRRQAWSWRRPPRRRWPLHCRWPIGCGGLSGKMSAVVGVMDAGLLPGLRFRRITRVVD